MATHLNEVKGIITLLNQMETGLSDELCALLILVTLPEPWATTTSSLSNSNMTGKLTVKMVTATLLEEEVRRKNARLTISTGELAIAERHGTGKRSGREDKTCLYCGKGGHLKKNCWTYKKHVKDGTVKEDGAANVVYSGELVLAQGKGGKLKNLPSDLV